MKSLSVRLSDEELEWLEDLVRAGRFRSRSEAIRAAIELLLYRAMSARATKHTDR